MKPFWMIFVGLSHAGHVETGKHYKIVGKEREVNPDGTVWYTYLFIDDAGNVEGAASKLFVKSKNPCFRRRDANPSN